MDNLEKYSEAKVIANRVYEIVSSFYPIKSPRIEWELNQNHNNGIKLSFNIFPGGYQILFTPGKESSYEVFGSSKTSLDVEHNLTEEEIIAIIEILKNDLLMMSYSVSKETLKFSYALPFERWDNNGLSFFCLEFDFSTPPAFRYLDLKWINNLLLRTYSAYIKRTPQYKKYCDEHKEKIKKEGISVLSIENMKEIVSKCTKDELTIMLETLSLERVAELYEDVVSKENVIIRKRKKED